MATYTADIVITRNGAEVHRGGWFPAESAESEPGRRCECTISADSQLDLTELPERCGYCDQPIVEVEVVVCPNCDLACLDDPAGGKDSFIEHLTDECGQ